MDGLAGREDTAMIDHRAMSHEHRLAPRRSASMRAVVWLATALMMLAMAAPVAARPTRECGNDKFELMTMEAFRQLSIDVGVPPELLFTPEWEAGWAGYDKNSDTKLCVKDKPDTPGHLGSWVWNVVDNTSNH
jgi:hypothetical protein